MLKINAEGLTRTKYKLGHIFLPLSENASHEDVSEVRKKALKLIKELRDGANFQEYAITYSSGEKALSGGQLGWRSVAELPSLFAVVKTMQDGAISEPLRSSGGMHILNVMESEGRAETH